MKRDLIKWFAREYPTATSSEIGMVIHESSQLVAAYLDRKASDDASEYAKRRQPGADVVLVRIMKRRLAERQQVAA